MKTSELTGAALDWAVAKCEGATNLWFDTVSTHWMNLHGKDIALKPGWAQSYSPSTDWAQGGPIIEREFICIEGRPGMSEGWAAHYSKMVEALYFYSIGPTPLVAAMRCYVASKLGDEVEIPKELV